MQRTRYNRSNFIFRWLIVYTLCLPDAADTMHTILTISLCQRWWHVIWSATFIEKQPLMYKLLFVFRISSILHHHPTLPHRHTLILDRLLTFLMAFSTLVLKLSFSQSLPSIAVYPFLRLISGNHMTTCCLAVTGCDSIGKCVRLSQPWLFCAHCGTV